MSTPAAKRRRIEAATALSKPFRSPFKTPLKSPTSNSTSQHVAIEVGTPATAAEVNSSVFAQKSTNTLLATKPLPKAHTPRLNVKKFTSPISAATLHSDPDIAPLLKAQRELEKQLREVKEELDAAQQARKIEGESRRKWLAQRGNGEENADDEEGWDGEIDGELVELIGRWRGASQMAAEELFGRVRDRVNRMGGPRAWKEAQKKQAEYQGGWDQEEPNQNNNNDDDDQDGQKQDVYAEYGIDPETDNEKSQRTNGVGDTGEMPGQEDEFTMAMMLRTLNVDLDIIGYDRDGQRWNE